MTATSDLQRDPLPADPDELRRRLLLTVVLGPPRAMEPWGQRRPPTPNPTPPPVGPRR